jgi:MBG domain (YGX type)
VFTGTITGLKNADAITASYASTAVAGSPVGTFAIIPALADPTGKLVNYTVTSTNGALTMTPAALSVSAANVTRLYGDANPSFTGTITGLKNGDAITASFATTATLASSVGTFSIVPALVDPAGKLGNYTVVSNNAVLTITPAPLSVSAANATRLYGDANPVFAGTIVGLKNGDIITATYASVDATSVVGTYVITPTLVDPGAKVGNYSVASNTGTLTITPAPLSVVAANTTRLVGDLNPAFTGTITGLKNADLITAKYTTSAVATSPVGTYAIVPTLVDPTGKLVNYLVTLNNGTLTINPVPTPAAVSVTPLSGTTTSAVFSATYSDAAGASLVKQGLLLINNIINWPGSCGARYLQAANQLFLINDAGSGWLGPITPGSAATLQNSQCVLNASGSSAATAGTTLTVNFSVSFLPTFVGSKNVYLQGQDTTHNVSSAWTKLGTWSLPVPTPTPVSVTPNVGTATSAVFSAVYSDTAGAAKISQGLLLINNAVTFTGSCSTRYNQTANQLFLINDAGNGWLGPITPGAAATLQNSQCVLNGSGSSAAAAGNTLTVNFSISFLPAFIGSKNVYLQGQDSANGVNSAWTSLGTWSLPIPIPAAVSVTPNVGTATSAVFSAVYSDTAGAAKITQAYLLVNNIINWPGSCGVRYSPATNQLFLINDAGNGWLGPITPGAAATLQNTQCVLNANGSSAAAAGNTLTVNFNINFLPTFKGAKNLYLQAQDTVSNTSSGWNTVGTWTLP